MRPTHLINVAKPTLDGDFSYWSELDYTALKARYLLAVPPEVATGVVDTIPGNNTTTATIAPGGSFTGFISPDGDIDWIAVNLVAGETYLFSLRGTGTSPLDDPFLRLRNSAGTLLRSDDDGGNGLNSILTFTATTTGVHYIDAQSFNNGTADVGQYTVDVRAKSATPDVPDTFAGAVTLGTNDTIFSFVDNTIDPGYYLPDIPSNEVDTYKLTLNPGDVLTIEAAGGANSFFSQVQGEVDTVLVLYDSLGNAVAFNDDISFPGDISSRLTYISTTGGTYYLDLASWQGAIGGYTITTSTAPLSSFDPLDAINWFNADNIDVGPGGVVKIYFALPGENFGELADDGVSPAPSFGWNAFEKQQVLDALNSEYGKILGYTYVETTVEADAEFRIFTTTSEQFGAFFYPQDPAFGSSQGVGAFNVDSGAWNFGAQQSLLKGGFAYAVILHEFGHAHGLAHPHDNGGGSDIMLGVTGPFDSYGLFDLNQGVYTVMSYNDAFPAGPNGETPFTVANIDSGWSGGLGAFDIAMLQERYGIINPHNTGNDVYQLGDANDPGVYYTTIWDTGGTDEIRYSGNRNARIDLLAATIDYSPTGGGVVSYVDDIFGGYTIARGVVVENATGGEGDDGILGNAVANVLTGNGGDDVLVGRAGGDTLLGGAGFDTASYIDAASGVAASLATGTGTGGDAAGDTFNSIEKLVGSQFNDTLGGGNNDDVLQGLNGNDNLSGANSEDTLEGGGGDDLLDGGNHDDLLLGGDGNDTLNGGNHNDNLQGGIGNDTLDGGNHNDLLNGGAGNDLLTGGNQNDVFLFTETGYADRILDFKKGQDKIDLSEIDANSVAGGHQAFAWIGAGAFTGVAGQLRSFSSGGNNFVAGDTNGDFVADFVIQTNLLIAQTDVIFV